MTFHAPTEDDWWWNAVDEDAQEWTRFLPDDFDALAGTSLFVPTQASQAPGLAPTASVHSRKRPRQDDTANVAEPAAGYDLEQQLEALRDRLPELFPQSPSVELRPPFRALQNPYLENQADVAERYTSRPNVRRPEGTGIVNGYLKFVIRSNDNENAVDITRRNSGRPLGPHALGSRLPRGSASDGYNDDNVSRLPEGYGSNARMDAVDRKILRFYISAICSGRTLLPRTNAWLDLGSVIDSHECARHAALAFSAGYMLDYVPSPQLRVRANFHYKRASDLITRALNDPSIYEFGNEEGIVTALHLLWSDDIVQWELRRSKTERPRWRCGTLTAKTILDDTDPGYRYWLPENVQTTSVRRSNANMCAYAEICALPVTKLSIVDMDKLYPWLLEGSERDVREIHGGTGVSPKLLHIYAQITQLSARSMEDSGSPILICAADAIMHQLTNFHQTSEVSDGYETTQELLDACVLDGDGLVQSPVKVTELTGETWVQAAQIYLYCRFYRMPRWHPKVLHSLSALLRCVERMPTSGELFTAQSPFFCIFMAALVAYQDQDRLALRSWFDVIVSGASGRSSVQPVYDILEAFWRWIDAQAWARPAATHIDGRLPPLEKRVPWWEHMTEWFLENYGELSLV